MPDADVADTPPGLARPTDAELIALAARALNPQLLGAGFWVADVGAVVESEDGHVFTGACIGGYLSICAEMAALGQLVSVTTPTIARVVAVWRDPTDGQLYVLPPCGRCREFMRTLSEANLDATVILGADHRASLRDLLPVPGWHAERVSPRD